VVYKWLISSFLVMDEWNKLAQDEDNWGGGGGFLTTMIFCCLTSRKTTSFSMQSPVRVLVK
jgi:hypothetical protein